MTRVRPWPVLVGLALATPLASLAFILRLPEQDVRLQEFAGTHFAITTNIAMVAAVVALILARTAAGDGSYGDGSYRTLLVALGFESMAGIFAVHGLATPGVLFTGGRSESAATLVVAVSSHLSLLVPAAFFAARYVPRVRALERSAIFRPRRLVAGTVGALLLYGATALAAPEILVAMAETVTGQTTADLGEIGQRATIERFGAWIALSAVATVALLSYAAWQQARELLRAPLPTHAALVLSYLLLAEAQVAMIPGAVHVEAFWQYHALMALATVLAVAALYVELDRRRGLERFLPPTVVERVVTGAPLLLQGERRAATILFTDLRDSTAMAERLSPEGTIEALNAYLRTMARAVLVEGGILDKFTGDGLMAIFGAMGDRTDGAEAAVRAAARVRTEIARLNADRTARGEPVVGYGIGMHSGPVVLGAVGLPERSDYTAVGDTVNTAARMEGLTKRLGVDIIVSSATAACLDGRVPLRPLGEVEVSGKEQRLLVYTLA